MRVHVITKDGWSLIHSHVFVMGILSDQFIMQRKVGEQKFMYPFHPKIVVTNKKRNESTDGTHEYTKRDYWEMFGSQVKKLRERYPV